MTLFLTALTIGVPVAPLPSAFPIADALQPRGIRTWSIELPADPFQKISGSIPISHDGGEGFVVLAEGEGLKIDTDGDGEPDRVVEGREHPETKVRFARVTLSGERAGEAFRYPVRLEMRGSGWAYASSSVLEGTVEGTAIQLIDVDGNGSFHDVGTDAVTVQGSDVAQFLGESLLVGDTLHALAFEEAGGALRVSSTPYDQKVGTLDLRSAFGGKGVMLGAVVQSVNRKHSFELSSLENGAKVPVGRYRLVSATLGLGDARATVDPAGMRSIKVKADEVTALQWGAPVKASFTFASEGGKVVLDPENVRYVGAGGERWVGWNPIGKSPTFHIKDANTGKVLVDAVFPGSC